MIRVATCPVVSLRSLGIGVFGDKSLSLSAALGSLLIILPQVALSSAGTVSSQLAKDSIEEKGK